MKTILFNTDTNEPLGKTREGYYTVDGVRPELPANVVELEVTEVERPEFDAVKQKVTVEWLPDFETSQYIQTWTISNKDETEITDYIKQQGEMAVQNVKYQLYRQEMDEKYNQNLTAITALDDESALNVAEQYPPFNPDGHPYKAKNETLGIEADRFYYPINGKLYKVISDHNSQPDWLPNEAVSLYVEVVPPGQAVPWNADDYTSYELGTKVTHDNKTWECINPTYAWIEPGSQDGHYGWVESPG